MNRRRILVIGASSVLGSASAQVLADEGAELLLTYCRPEKESGLRAAFPGAEVFPLDVRDPEGVRQFGAQVAARGRALDGLIYAAGLGLLHPATRSTDDRMTEVMDVNFQGAVRVLRACWPALQAGTDASVVLFTSIMGVIGAAGMSGYGASKAAVAGLARSLAIEWAPRGIRVNAIAPGIVPSPLVDKMFKGLTPEDVEVIRKRHPLGFGAPEDVGQAVAFLLSPKAKWITGVVLPVDGGYTAQ